MRHLPCLRRVVSRRSTSMGKAKSYSAEAQKEFDRAVALLHSFQFNHAIQGFNAALKSDHLRNRALGNRTQPVEQSVRGWHEGQQPAAGGARERRTEQSRWRKNGARTSVHRGRRQSVQQLREHATASAFARLSRCDGRSRVEIFRRSGGADFLRASACGCGRADRQNLRRAAQGGRGPGEAIPGRTGPSRAGALHHSHLRRAVSGGKGAHRRAALFRYRA